MYKAKKIKRNTIRGLLKLLSLSLLISLSFNSVAQKMFSNPEVKAVAVIDTNAILVGQQTDIHLQITAPKDVFVQWPQIGDTLSKNVEVIHYSNIDTIASDKDDLTHLSQTITISSFDSGYFAIPPFYFIYGKKNDSLYDITETNALLLQVNNVKVDLSKEIKDIKPILDEPWTFMEILPYILIGLGIILLILLAMYIYNRKKQHKPIFSLPEKPKLPAHVIALQKLDMLKDKKLWQSGNMKEYYSELTDIIREYMEGQMNFGAMEMVSDDILSELQDRELDENLYKDTQEVLQTADLVKFAKVKPLADECDRALKWGYSFVEQTKPGEEKPKTDSELEVEPSKTIDQ